MFKGIIPALVTPLDENGNVNFPVLKRLEKAYREKGE